ncbi:hypothetical protein [Burkholderia sp. JKS000303]|uniref:hypothetical protein n=1 Tax=Burkholderia sp. JKS000303 TaxID=1938747 RepID=UPI00117F3A42|nr:hypothetical protein [Burkholderia sp. JKS000303]
MENDNQSDEERPAPLVPATCDLSGIPVPADMLVELAVQSFGISVEEATKIVREVAEIYPGPISDLGTA